MKNFDLVILTIAIMSIGQTGHSLDACDLSLMLTGHEISNYQYFNDRPSRFTAEENDVLSRYSFEEATSPEVRKIRNLILAEWHFHYGSSFGQDVRITDYLYDFYALPETFLIGGSQISLTPNMREAILHMVGEFKVGKRDRSGNPSISAGQAREVFDEVFKESFEVRLNGEQKVDLEIFELQELTASQRTNLALVILKSTLTNLKENPFHREVSLDELKSLIGGEILGAHSLVLHGEASYSYIRRMEDWINNIIVNINKL